MQRLSSLFLAASFLAPSLALAQESIVVVDSMTGCFGGYDNSYAWRLEPDGYRWDDKVVSVSELASIRERVLSTEHSTPDLAGQLEITATSIAAHRDEILDAAWPTMSLANRAMREEAATWLDTLLTPTHLTPFVDFMLVAGPVSTNRHSLVIRIPGDPRLTIRSDARQPWMLPWEVHAGARRWRTNDITVSRAVHCLLDPRGETAALVDGTKYWTEDFWTDGPIWSHILGPAIERIVAEQACCELRGFERTVGLLSIDAASVPEEAKPESLRVDVSFLDPSPIAGATWWNPLRDGRATVSWTEFLAVHDVALRCLATQRWLEEWRHASPERELRFDVVGQVGYVESDLRTIARRAWKDAGLCGEPELELYLMRAGERCATVWLSTAESTALITASELGTGEHWLDRVWISFGPRMTTYGLVDADGTFEKRITR